DNAGHQFLLSDSIFEEAQVGNLVVSSDPLVEQAPAPAPAGIGIKASPKKSVSGNSTPRSRPSSASVFDGIWMTEFETPLAAGSNQTRCSSRVDIPKSLLDSPLVFEALGAGANENSEEPEPTLTATPIPADMDGIKAGSPEPCACDGK